VLALPVASLLGILLTPIPGYLDSPIATARCRAACGWADAGKLAPTVAAVSKRSIFGVTLLAGAFIYLVSVPGLVPALALAYPVRVLGTITASVSTRPFVPSLGILGTPSAVIFIPIFFLAYLRTRNSSAGAADKLLPADATSHNGSAAG
jgi:hypothetical protein